MKLRCLNILCTLCLTSIGSAFSIVEIDATISFPSLVGVTLKNLDQTPGMGSVEQDWAKMEGEKMRNGLHSRLRKSQYCTLYYPN